MSPRARALSVAFPLLALLSVLPGISSGLALVAGMAFALAFGNPWLDLTKKWTTRLLQLSVIGLGAGMDLRVVAQVGLQGVGYTAVGILSTLALGALLGRLLKSGADTSVLISSGTAICGGSAIAAVSSAIGARHAETAVSLATIFLLNAAALLLFPPLGHQLGLDQRQFGLWSALAIHDTSSVVGASLQYGAEALQIATTVKLARALWIVPVALYFGWRRTRQGQAAGAAKAKRPWFILGFLAAAAVVTWLPALRPAGDGVAYVARRSLVLCLFLIGSQLSRATLGSVGARPLIQAVLLWLAVGSGTLAGILAGWIR